MDVSEQYQGCILFVKNGCYLQSLPFPVAIHHIPNQLSCVEAKKRTPLKNMKLDKFFLKLYVEQGGMLPNKLLVMLWGYCGFLQSYNHWC